MALYNKSFDNRRVWPLDYEGRFVAKLGKMKRVNTCVYQVPVSIGDRLTGKTYQRTGTIQEVGRTSCGGLAPPPYYNYGINLGTSHSRVTIRWNGKVIDLDDLLDVEAGAWRL